MTCSDAPAPEWILEAGRVRLRVATEGVLEPSAGEIFAAEYHGADVRGLRAPPPSSQIQALQFSRYPATPAYRVSDAAGSLLFEIGAILPAAGFMRVPQNVDQVVHEGWWYPLHSEALAEARAWAETVGLSESSPLTLGGLILLRTRAERPVSLIDDVTATPQSLARLATATADYLRGLEATLYQYQSAGVGFLMLVASQGIGCVLADAMGLGKTLQVIALLVAEKNMGRSPALVIAPATLLENWRRELATFAPSLTVRVHAGADRPGTTARLAGPDVTLVSYETAVRDEQLLTSKRWNVVVLDEAQNIKNPDAQRTRTCKRLDRRVSVAVTGTPFENRLEDLWSIVDFALPSLLGTIGSFRDEYAEIASDAQRVGALVSPVVLRRTIEEVASDLPPRIDIPQPLVMPSTLATAYERERSRVIGQYGPAANFVATTSLRMLCAHPALVQPWAADPCEDMPKYARLIEILEEVVAAGEKALIFSTFQDMADLMLADLNRRFKASFFRCIDGRVPVEQRQVTVDEFFAYPGSGALVLNPKAAGTGLNITAANHVIHYNPEWNPAVTDQATARAFRRRQLRPVTVHYLYFVDSIEEAIIDRASFKRHMAGEAVQGHHGDIEGSALARALQLSPLKDSRGQPYVAGD